MSGIPQEVLNSGFNEIKEIHHENPSIINFVIVGVHSISNGTILNLNSQIIEKVRILSINML